MEISFPIVVAGQPWQGDPAELVDMQFVTGATLRLPGVCDAAADAILKQDRFLLRDVPLYEIVAFMNLVGRNWKSTEYSRRRLYIRYLMKFLGYSKEMAELEANWIALLLCSHHRFLDTVAVELGNRRILDHWVPCEEAEIRAFPRGRSLHVLAGNVPLSGVASILRALVTKNVCVVKPSSDDPFTPVMLAMSFLDANPQNPVARALSIAYWEGGALPPAARRLVADADTACVWGGRQAIDWARTAFSSETEVITFGPRRSLAVIGRDADVDEAVRRLAHNICMYDQRACFSVRQVFVEGRSEQVVAALKRALAHYAKLLPKGVADFDESACWSLAQKEAQFCGELVATGDAQSWSIIACTPEQALDHPLGRTICVHEVDDVREVARHVNSEVQTVAVAPYRLGQLLRDDLAKAGASRVVDLGLSNVFRVGGSHDAMYPLQRLVRMVSIERPGEEHPKGITLPIDQTTFLEEDRFVEFIP